jgi:hypothetical protein
MAKSNTKNSIIMSQSVAIILIAITSCIVLCVVAEPSPESNRQKLIDDQLAPAALSDNSATEYVDLPCKWGLARCMSLFFYNLYLYKTFKTTLAVYFLQINAIK